MAGSVVSRRRYWLLLVWLLWASAFYLFQQHRRHGPAHQSIGIRWAAETDDLSRQAAERALRLRDGEAQPSGAWSYRPLDHSRSAIERIVSHRLVADTNHIDRRSFRLDLDAPRVPLWVRTLLAADQGPGASAALAAAGAAVFWYTRRRYRRSVAETEHAVSRWRTVAPYMMLAVCLQSVVALWVPIRTRVVPDYLRATLFERAQPRALIGTFVQLFEISDTQFLVIAQLCLFAWLTLVSLLVATPPGEHRLRPLTWRAAAVTFLFGFSTLPFVNNALSGYVDIFSATAVAYALWLLCRGHAHSARTIAAVTLALCVATMIHEKSVFEAVILLGWIAFTQRHRRAVMAIGGYVAFTVTYLAWTSGSKAPSSAMTTGEYFNLLPGPLAFLEHYSFNVIGLLVGGGMLWLVAATVMSAFVLEQTSRSERLAAAGFVVGTAVVVFAQLLIAWDTSRLAAIVWLPTLVLFHGGHPSYRFDLRKVWPAVLLMAVVCQAIIPPALVYRHRAMAFNCYASFAAQRWEEAQQTRWWAFARDVEPLRLHFDVEGTARIEVSSCVPIHLTTR